MEALLLVVSKTRMGKLVCIGGLIHNPDGTLRSVRLIKDNGWNHNETEAEDFKIGSLYIGNFGEKYSNVPPHTEDIICYSVELFSEVPFIISCYREAFQSPRPIEFGKLTVTEIKFNEISQRYQATLEQKVNLFYVNDISLIHHEVLLSDVSTNKYKSKRTVWMDVEETATIEEMQAKVDSWDQPRIIVIYSCAPLLSENQQSAISAGLTTFDKIKMSQLVRTAERTIVPYLKKNFVDPTTGEVKSRFVAQFKVNSLTVGGKTDIDLRENEHVWLDEELETMIAEDQKQQKDNILTTTLSPYDVFYKVKYRKFSINKFEHLVKANPNYKLSYKSITIKSYLEIFNFPITTDRSLLFEGSLKTSSWSTKYINRDQIPSFSTCFAIFDHDLVGNIDEQYGGYFYLARIKMFESSFVTVLKVKYVGLAEPIQVIPKGTLIRFSLARWWRRNDDSEEQCTLQLSGWYDLNEKFSLTCRKPTPKGAWFSVERQSGSGCGELPGMLYSKGEFTLGQSFIWEGCLKSVSESYTNAEGIEKTRLRIVPA